MESVCVLGAGRSGLAAAQYARELGKGVCLVQEGPISLETQEILQKLAIPFQYLNTENIHTEIQVLLNKTTQLVVSPGIPLTHPLVQGARRKNIPVLSEIDMGLALYGEQRKHGLPPSVAITGTNGKSTTTHYLAHFLKTAGHNAVDCGNIGHAFSSALREEGKHNPFFIVELSSYQLELTENFLPQVGVFLNGEPNHLQRYGDFNQYMKAKWRLLLLIPSHGLGFVPHSILVLAYREGWPLPQCPLVVTHIPAHGDSLFSNFQENHTHRALLATPSGVRTLPRALYGDFADPLHCGLWHWQPVPWFQPQPQLSVGFSGAHNAFNTWVAHGAAVFLMGQWRFQHGHGKYSEDQWSDLCQRSVDSYVPLPHRLQWVRNKPFPVFNDSKSTNVASTLTAVGALKADGAGLCLLLGGVPKGDSFEVLKQYPHIASVHTFGAGARSIADQLQGAPFPVTVHGRMVEAIDGGVKWCLAHGGSALLLSPGCASFDEFSNFEHRGRAFTMAIQKLFPAE